MVRLFQTKTIFVGLDLKPIALEGGKRVHRERRCLSVSIFSINIFHLIIPSHYFVSQHRLNRLVNLSTVSIFSAHRGATPANSIGALDHDSLLPGSLAKQTSSPCRFFATFIVYRQTAAAFPTVISSSRRAVRDIGDRLAPTVCQTISWLR